MRKILLTGLILVLVASIAPAQTVSALGYGWACLSGNCYTDPLDGNDPTLPMVFGARIRLASNNGQNINVAADPGSGGTWVAFPGNFQSGRLYNMNLSYDAGTGIATLSVTDTTNGTNTATTTFTPATPFTDLWLQAKASTPDGTYRVSLNNVMVNGNSLGISLSDPSSSGTPCPAGSACDRVDWYHVSGFTDFLSNGFTLSAGIVPDAISYGAGSENLNIDLMFGNDAAFLAQADLEVTKTADVSRAELDSVVNYTVDVTNNGPGLATAVDLVDTLPAGLSLISATWTGPMSSGTCSAVGQVITCSVGGLDNGESATATIQAQVTAEGTLTNSATATDTGGTTFDPNSTNSTATVDLDSFYPLPTLHPMALGFLALLLALGGVWVIRR